MGDFWRSGLKREGGGLFQILKHRFHLKIVVVQKGNNCNETLNGMATLLCIFV